MTESRGSMSLPRLLLVSKGDLPSGLIDALRSENHQVSVCRHPERELDRLLRQEPPDLAFVDSEPASVGLETVGAIRKRDDLRTGHTPVVMLMPPDASASAKEPFAGLVDDFLSLSADRIEILARTRSLLRFSDLRKRTHYLATHDHLTRCYNRRYLVEFLDREIARYKRASKPFALLHIDLDRFQKINGEFGQSTGDQMLMHFGFRLQDFFRAVDCVGRWGADEFAVVLPDCPDPRPVADRLMRIFEDPKRREGLPPHLLNKLKFSVGIARFPFHGPDRDDLLLAAQKALKNAQKAGGARYSEAVGPKPVGQSEN